MRETKARLLATICLLLILVPFTFVAREYMSTRSRHLNVARVQPQVTTPPPVQEVPEKYVPPEPISYPIY